MVRSAYAAALILLVGLCNTAAAAEPSVSRHPTAKSTADTGGSPPRTERRCRSLAHRRGERMRRAAVRRGATHVPRADRLRVRRKLRRCLRAVRRAAERPSDGVTDTPGDGGPGSAAPPPGSTLLSFVGVTASDDDGFRLTLSRPAVAAGTVTIELRNNDSGPHDLVVEPDGGGAEVARFDAADPGVVARRSVALPAGRWRLYCSLPNHAALGMEATLRAE
jgi:hypothetical protein